MHDVHTAAIVKERGTSQHLILFLLIYRQNRNPHRHTTKYSPNASKRKTAPDACHKRISHTRPLGQLCEVTQLEAAVEGIAQRHLRCLSAGRMLCPACHHVGVLRRAVGQLFASLPLCARKGLILGLNIERLLAEVFVLLRAGLSRVVGHSDGMVGWTEQRVYDVMDDFG